MYVVVSDTNVFVALFKSRLLQKVFDKARVEVVIPTTIFEELTEHPHRVVREYLDLSKLIKTLIYNAHHGQPISLRLFDYKKELDSIHGLDAHCRLDNDAALDAGEREAIPCAIHLSAKFVTCDAAAIAEYNDIDEKNGSEGFRFEDYCASLVASGVITKEEFEQIKRAISE